MGLLELIDQLPTTSRLNEAIYNDPDEALRIVIAREKGASTDVLWTPRQSEFGVDQMMMQRLIHAVEVGTEQSKANHGTRPSRVVAFPGPETLVDRLATERREQRQTALFSILTPTHMP